MGTLKNGGSNLNADQACAIAAAICMIAGPGAAMAKAWPAKPCCTSVRSHRDQDPIFISAR